MSEKSGFNNYRLIIMTVAISLFSGAMAQSLSLLPEIQRLSLPLNERMLSVYGNNPAAMLDRDSISLSSFAVGADINRQSRPVMEQLGDGHNIFGLSADSYTHLGDENLVWGAASFATGSYRSVRWTDCIDYNRVAPYVLGDEVGGDLSVRSYRFSGGYARSFSRWTAGVHASYRAEIAYRNRDPRIKTVVSDLDINFGGSYRISSNNLLGLNVGINIYDQNCDLDFYSPVNEINTYTLTGLGTYYRRFMGNTNKNSGYASFGYNVGLQWLPIEKRGLAIAVNFRHYRMEQLLRNFNNLTLGFTDNDIADLSVIYCWRLNSRLTLQPSLEGAIHRRKGTENLFGSASGASYDKIGSRSPYSHDVRYLAFSLPFQFAFGISYLTLTPSIGYESEEEKYMDPLRKLEVRHFVPGLGVDFSMLTNRDWLWRLDADIDYAKADSNHEILTDLDTTSPLGQCVLSNYSMLKADRAGCGVSAEVSRQLKRFVLSLSLSYRITDYRNEGRSHTAAVSIAAKF